MNQATKSMNGKQVSNAEKFNDCNDRDDSYCLFEKQRDDIIKFIDSDEFDDICAEFGEFDFTKPLDKLKTELKKRLSP